MTKRKASVQSSTPPTVKQLDAMEKAGSEFMMDLVENTHDIYDYFEELQNLGRLPDYMDVRRPGPDGIKSVSLANSRLGVIYTIKIVPSPGNQRMPDCTYSMCPTIIPEEISSLANVRTEQVGISVTIDANVLLYHSLPNMRLASVLPDEMCRWRRYLRLVSNESIEVIATRVVDQFMMARDRLGEIS